MTNARRAFSTAEEISLTTEVGGYCPLCGAALFYRKKGRSHKSYELAHIYPLNPRPEELEELKNVELLHSDVNHLDNIIPLCASCHTQFDKPRTIDEYKRLVEIKQKLISKAKQRALIEAYPIEDEIGRIIARLHEVTIDEMAFSDLELQAKSVDDKLDESLPIPIRRKIKHAVTDYYQHIKHEFLEMERSAPASSALIYSQVRTFYLKQKALGFSQQVIFNNVVEWLRHATESESQEAAEIIAAFFVQNCEVFE
jgi:hypothetical protein